MKKKQIILSIKYFKLSVMKSIILLYIILIMFEVLPYKYLGEIKNK